MPVVEQWGCYSWVDCGADLSGCSLGVFRQVVRHVAVAELERLQMVFADVYGVSQFTVLRINHRMLHLVRQALSFTGSSPAEAARQKHLPLADGMYVPAGGRLASGQERESYSGEHGVQCPSLKVATVSSGELVGVAGSVLGSRYDSKVLSLCGGTQILDPPDTHWTSDTAYVATSALTPIENTPGRQRIGWEKAFDKTVALLRALVEHSISHLKN